MSFRIVAAVIFASQVTGCASIVNGQNQSVSVETRSESGAVSGAGCKLSNNKGSWFVTTPGSTIVQRSFEDLSVKCEKDPMAPGLASVKSGTKAMAFGNILFGGFIGVGVDVATGAAYDYPTIITVTMGKSLALDAQGVEVPVVAASGATAPKAAAPAPVPSAGAALGPAVNGATPPTK